MRFIMVASLLLGTLVSSSTSAQYHHRFCRLVAGGRECAYDTLAQCESSKTAEDQSCVPNSAPGNHEAWSG
jgi:hypothetical protein